MLLGAAPALALPADQPLPSKVIAFDEMPAHREDHNIFRSVLEGVTNNGDHIELHETQLAPGSQPHPPHRHAHEEMFLIRRGTLRVLINERSTEIGPGSVAFIHSGELHGISNAGTEPAEYFVLAFGTDRG
jgi:quercetin dioxygenase-like cupin family protein